MPEYLSPGVYVEEVPSGMQPLEGVGTSTGAFVGLAEKGVTDTPVLITNYTQFVNEFGGFVPNSYLAYAVYSFFAEGGSRCYVVRVASADAAASTVTVNDGAATPVDLFKVDARSVGTWGDNVSISIADPSTADSLTHFKLTVTYNEPNQSEYPTVTNVVEEYDNISLDTIESKVNGISSFVTVTRIEMTTLRPPVSASEIYLANGSDGNPAADFIGTSAARNGLYAFDVIDDINIVAIPDIAGSRDDIILAINYCEQRQDCFFLVDPPLGTTPQGVVTFKDGTGTEQALNSASAGLYYPWVVIKDPMTKVNRAIPPSGVVAGTYSATDGNRGVHKAPAGTSDGFLNSVVGIEQLISKGEQDTLNPKGINVIRSFPGTGIAIWGARTLSSVAEWRYVNVRRLMMYIKESLDQGTQFVVFEPNSPVLWGQVRRTITAFLTRVWRDGALFGAKPEEAFFVKVDEENNPPEVRDAGQLIVEVGVAPVKPAEFVVIRISQQTQTAK